MSEPRDGTLTVLFVIVGIVLICFGAMLEMFYCEYRRGNDLELTHQALAVGGRCMETLGEVVPGALILARQPSRPVALRPAARDSLRELRWTQP